MSLNFKKPQSVVVLPACPKCLGWGFTLQPNQPPADLESIAMLTSYRIGIACSCPTGEDFRERQAVELSREAAEDQHVSGHHPGYVMELLIKQDVRYRSKDNPFGNYEDLICTCGFHWAACVGFARSSLASVVNQRQTILALR